MKLGALIKGYQRMYNYKNGNSITTTYRVISFTIYAITSFFKHISETIKGNLIKLDTLREGNKK